MVYPLPNLCSIYMVQALDIYNIYIDYHTSYAYSIHFIYVNVYCMYNVLLRCIGTRIAEQIKEKDGRGFSYTSTDTSNHMYVRNHTILLKKAKQKRNRKRNVHQNLKMVKRYIQYMNFSVLLMPISKGQCREMFFSLIQP